MKKVFLSLVALATFGVSLVASEQQPASMFEALRNLPGAQGATEAELCDLKAYLNDLETTFSGVINPAFEGVNSRNSEGFEVFKQIVGADKFVITLQPLNTADLSRSDADEDDASVEFDEEYEDEA